MSITLTALGTANSGGSNVGTLSLTLTAAVAVGESILVQCVVNGNPSGATLADTAGNSYATDVNALIAPNFPFALFRADSALPLGVGDTITVTLGNASRTCSLVAYKASSAILPAFVVSTNASGSSTAAASGATTNANTPLPGSLALGFIHWDNSTSTTSTPTSPWSTGQATASGTTAVQAIYQSSLAGGGTFNAQSTLSNSKTWTSVVALYRAAATFYVDYELGSDNNGGDSFAVTATNTDGVTNGTNTFTSAGAAFDSTYLGRKIGIVSAGSLLGNYTIVAVASATSITLSGTPASHTGCTYNVGGCWKTLKTGMLTGVQGANLGDTVRVKASLDPQDTGVTAVWTSNATAATPDANSKKITLGSALTQLIDSGDSAWTPSTNVTQATDSGNFREGTASQKLLIAAGFTTGMFGFKATGTLDLSAYHQVTFWIMSSVTTTAGQLQLLLCSDVAGVTAVNTINLPAVPVTNTWQAVTVDTGGALGSSIKSVALSLTTDLGAQNVWIDNINAVPAPGVSALSLNSVVGKNYDSTHPEYGQWWSVLGINGTTVTLDGAVTSNAGVSTNRGYYGISETVELYKREPIPFNMSSAVADLQVPTSVFSNTTAQTNSGTTYLLVEGGWDRTAMTSQSGRSWFSGQNYAQAGLVINTSTAGVSLNGFGSARFAQGLLIGNSGTNANNKIGELHISSGINGVQFSAFTSPNNAGTIIAVGCSGVGLLLTANPGNIICSTKLVAISCSSSGLTLSTVVSNAVFGTVTCCNNGSSGVVVSGTTSGNLLIGAAGDFKVNNGYGFSFTGANNVSEMTVRGAASFASNASGSVNIAAPVEVHFYNASSSDTTPVTSNTAGSGGLVTFDQYGASATDYRKYTDKATILTATDQRHTASGVSWKITPVATANSGYLFFNGLNPERLEVAQVAVNSGSAVTIGLWVRRASPASSVRLICPGGQVPGVATDVSSSGTSGGVGAWEQLTITFTPTAAGVVRICADVWGGSSPVWLDDFSRSQ